VLTFTLIMLAGAALAGFLGSLTGLGGGVVLIPLMVLIMGVDMHYAIAASLVAVIATSSGAAAAFVREGFTNIRLGILLEVATVSGALVGALLAPYVPLPALAITFGLVMLWSAYSTVIKPKPLAASHESDPLAIRLALPSTYPTPQGLSPYGVRHVVPGLLIMLAAGILSALVGIGSGVVKVLAMDRAMRIPFKVSTATSNFMIGVTAAASAGVYLHRGQIDPTLAAPVALGAMGGAFLGGKLLPKIKTRILRIVFAAVIAIMGVQMVYKGLTGSFTPQPAAEVAS
jgi:uncharacterized membrane protein YfcA